MKSVVGSTTTCEQNNDDIRYMNINENSRPYDQKPDTSGYKYNILETSMNCFFSSQLVFGRIAAR